ncbi:MAG: hypothetical protein V4638_02980 [Bacteroidota bacterium]
MLFFLFSVACQFTNAQFNVDFSGTPAITCEVHSIQFNDLSTPTEGVLLLL